MQSAKKSLYKQKMRPAKYILQKMRRAFKYGAYFFLLCKCYANFLPFEKKC